MYLSSGGHKDERCYHKKKSGILICLITNPNIYEQTYVLVCDVQSSAASSSLHISCMASFYAPHSLLKTDITLQTGNLWTHGLLYSHQPRPLGAL